MRGPRDGGPAAGPPSHGVSVDRLAGQAGEPVARLEEWYALGLLPGESAALLDASGLERIRLIQFAERRGVRPRALAETFAAQGDLLGEYVRMLAPSGPRAERRLADVAAVTGLDAEFVERIASMVRVDEHDVLYDDDVEALAGMRFALEAGFPEDAVIQLVRVLTDAMNRVAETESRLFHFYVHERLRLESSSGSELMASTQAVSAPLFDLVEPTVLYFHRKGWERALREDLMLHVLEGLASGEQLGQLRVVVAFVDLVGFTSLSDAMGDATAAAVLGRFSEIVRAAAARHAGSVVKQIGDEFMVVFSDGRTVVEWAVEVEDAIDAEPRFPAARVGAHLGPVLYREGDYVGVNVNIAARVAAEARRHELLVTREVVQDATDVSGVEFVSLGFRRLRGLSDEVELLKAVWPHHRRPHTVDPVCGMELDPDDAAGSVNRAGRELWFCSMECLQRFTADPEHYDRLQAAP